MKIPELHEPCQHGKKQIFKKGRWYRKGTRPNTKAMKRHNGLFEQIASIENLQLADRKARRGKRTQRAVISHMENEQANLLELQRQLISGTFKTSQYTTFSVFEPKERVVYRLPYFPDRIAHHAIMNVIEPILVGVMPRDTYSCIRGRGLHMAARNVRKVLKDVPGTTYCLKLDIRKFYPSINHAILKNLLRKKIKDNRLLLVLDEIIDSAPGLPIGNYLSQHLANFYLAFFDHWIKQILKVRYYFRYADDIVILSGSKPELHSVLADCRAYLHDQLDLHIKSNYQIFPVASRGIDFLGYKFYHTHVRIRKSIKQRFARVMKSNPNRASLAAYMGWLKHANTKNLIKKVLTDETIRRIQHRKECSTLCGRQNLNQQDSEQRNCSVGISNNAIHQKRQRPMSSSTIGS